MIQIRSQEEIIAGWCGKNVKPRVSIVCITFNHDQFIEDALISFLNQKTTFPIEIIVHDDASTDSTASIIRRYQNLYPQIIKPIYQTQNQYSINPTKPGEYAADKCYSDLVALCEGDDYWISESKLQRQYEMFAEYPNANLVCHRGIIVDQSGETVGESRKIKKSGMVDPQLVLKLGGNFCLTASVMIRKNVLKMIYRLDNFGMAGDVFQQNMAAIHGDVIMLNRLMCAYRIGHAGSYSSEYNKNISVNDNDKRYYSLKKTYEFLYREINNNNPTLITSLDYWFKRVEYFTAMGFLEQRNIIRFKWHARRAIGVNMPINVSIFVLYIICYFSFLGRFIPFFRELKRKLF